LVLFILITDFEWALLPVGIESKLKQSMQRD